MSNDRLHRREWESDGTVFIEFRRGQWGDLVARAEGGRLLYSEDTSEVEKEAIRNALR